MINLHNKVKNKNKCMFCQNNGFSSIIKVKLFKLYENQIIFFTSINNDKIILFSLFFPSYKMKMKNEKCNVNVTKKHLTLC